MNPLLLTLCFQEGDLAFFPETVYHPPHFLNVFFKFTYLLKKIVY